MADLDDDEGVLDDRELPDPSDMDQDDDLSEPCPHCGKPVFDEAERCPHCGEYISYEDEPVKPPPFWGVGVVVVLIFVVVVWVLWFR
jgi:predicted nucleic acid-binding Zn ribbon protein